MPFPGYGKEPSFLGTCRDPFSFCTHSWVMCSGRPCLNGEVGLVHLQWSLPVLPILWFFPVSLLCVSKGTSILLFQRNPNFVLTILNRQVEKSEIWWGCHAETELELDPLLFHMCNTRTLLCWSVLALFPLCCYCGSCAFPWLQAHKGDLLTCSSNGIANLHRLWVNRWWGFLGFITSS